MELGKSNWRNYERGIEKEWILANGIGGFSSSTVIGSNARRYHGLLVASLKPPVERHLVLSKIDENIIVGNNSYELSSFKTPGFIGDGFLNLISFSLDPLPKYTFKVEDVTIEKSICMVYGENTVLIKYKIISKSKKVKVNFKPLINYRNYHYDSEKWHMDFETNVKDDSIEITPYKLDVKIKIKSNNCKFEKFNDCYFYSMIYDYENERGIKDSEDHFIPGVFSAEIDDNSEKEIYFIGTIENDFPNVKEEIIIQNELNRIEKLYEKSAFKDEFAKTLVNSADKFIVHRKSIESKTILAGYHWFTDWGRDALIALPGLTLATKRFEDAREIMYTFSKYVKNGLVPNMFPDIGQEPLYNTVDASMWFFEAVKKYLDYTDDFEFISNNIFDSLEQIFNYYKNGTYYNIKMDEDGLIFAGERGTQLTWMDAKVGDWVVTPRHGKAVEINALWYNAVLVLSSLYSYRKMNNDKLVSLSDKIRKSFNDTFWNEEKKCLYDVVNDSFKDSKVRPNQIMAVSLSYPVLEGDRAKQVVEKVHSELYTAYGLRTLSKDDKDYRGIYIGDGYSRDGSYHQGIVWTWPLGHFITAYKRVYKDNPNIKSEIYSFISPFKAHIKDACLGSISEIFDGNEPLIPRGTCAQAWSVAEILRTYVEDYGIE